MPQRAVRGLGDKAAVMGTEIFPRSKERIDHRVCRLNTPPCPSVVMGMNNEGKKFLDVAQK
jgi:hypothetical protein